MPPKNFIGLKRKPEKQQKITKFLTPQTKQKSPYTEQNISFSFHYDRPTHQIVGPDSASRQDIPGIESFDEKLLLYISNKNSIGLLDASLFIDECIKITSVKHNLDYNVVYNIIFSKDYLKDCLLREKACTELELEECEKSCNCFYLKEYGCISRTIPDYQIINQDPDKYVKNNLTNIEDLKKIVHIASYLYYNYDGGGLTDNSFDALEYNLQQKLKIKKRLYEKIGAPPVDKIRTDLLYAMPSLNKAKPGSYILETFLRKFISKPGNNIQKNNKLCHISLKLDGVSGMVVYEEGILKYICTRGDGVIGGDVTYLKDYIKSIPHFLTSKTLNKEIFVVRGEFILTKDIWLTKYKDSYANARSFVSAKINSGYISPALVDILFVVHEIMIYKSHHNPVPPPSQALRILYSEGFTTVENQLLNEPTLFSIIELYKNKRNTSIFYIDGLVLQKDEFSSPAQYLGNLTKQQRENFVVKNPIDKIAFKMILEEQIRETKVINVEWNISRKGRYIPVAIFEAVYIDGNRLTRASAFHAGKVQDWNMGVGTKLIIHRSGDVIPQIKDCIISHNTIPIFPKTLSEGGYGWHWKGSNIVLDEIENNKEVLIKRILHFFETLGVPRIGEGTSKKFYEHGWLYPEDIVKASIADFTKIKGIGKKTAELFYHNIKEKMMTIPPDRFISASSKFESGIDRILLKKLFREIPEILNMNEDEIRKRFKNNPIKGYGVKRIDIIAKGIPKFREYLNSFAKNEIEQCIKHYIIKNDEIKKKGYNPKINGKIFVVTGFMGDLDYEIEDYIYENNGDFTNSVSSSISAVICGNITGEGKKLTKASELGIEVLTKLEFAVKYDVPLKELENWDEKNKEKEIQDDFPWK